MAEEPQAETPANQAKVRPGRDARGCYLPGVSGNPIGMAPGRLDPWNLLIATASKLCRDERRTYLEAALDKAWRRAIQGSAEHLRILLDRLAPARLALEHSGQVAVGVPLEAMGRAQIALDELLAIMGPERVRELLQ